MTELSELDRVKIENYTLRVLFMRQQLQQMEQERTAYIRKLEAQLPGYEWDDTLGRFMPKETGEVLQA